MPVTFPAAYAPNKLAIVKTTGVATWVVVASDGVGYATLALLTAAGKVPYPKLDPGMMLQGLVVQSETAAGAGGSSFYVAFNLAAAPADTAAELVPTGMIPSFSGPIKNVWVRATSATDYITLTGAH